MAGRGFIPGPTETRDLIAAWLALGVAFTLFFEGQTVLDTPSESLRPFAVVLVTVGGAFLLHELAHKVVAVRYGQLAAFRADYGMLFLAVMGGFIGFIFAAPGAVHHRGRLTDAQRGHISLAGPVTNLVLAAVFVPVWVLGVAPPLGARGVGINLLLAGFNMLPVPGLDGRSVYEWDTLAYLVFAVPSIGLAAWALFGGIGL